MQKNLVCVKYSQRISSPPDRKGYNTNNNNKISGATVFASDIDASINSELHPWQCSLRARGFRGRHKCGVTLLSGSKL